MTTPADSSTLMGEFAADVARRVTADGPLSMNEILPQVYQEFRSLAAYLMSGEPGAHTLRPTALANEAYLRLAGQTKADVRGKAHLLSIASTMMRRVLIDYARARGASKRGGTQVRVTLDDTIADPSIGSPGAQDIDLLDLHRALDQLGKLAERKMKVVEMVYFAGLSFEEVAQALEVSKRTVVRDWRAARAWLWNELVGGRARPS